MPLVEQWETDLWVVTHVYIDRTAKVNARADLKKKGEINTSRKFLISNPTSHHTLLIVPANFSQTDTLQVKSPHARTRGKLLGVHVGFHHSGVLCPFLQPLHPLYLLICCQIVSLKFTNCFGSRQLFYNKVIILG